MTKSETKIMGNAKTRASGSAYWLMSPRSFSHSMAGNRIVDASGNVEYNTANNSLGIRPVISLAPNIKYSDGNGSQTEPYVVETNP